MGLKIISKELNGLILFEPEIFQDERGFFMETYRAGEFESLGLPTDFVQENHSRSTMGVLRGMHFQWEKPQGKLIRVTLGKAFIAEADIRPGSPTLGRWWGTELSSENHRMLWVPAGFANGFVACSEFVEVQYKCTATWNKHGESGIKWNDPDIDIKWPIDNPILSEKDKNAQTLNEWLFRKESSAFTI